MSNRQSSALSAAPPIDRRNLFCQVASATTGITVAGQCYIVPTAVAADEDFAGLYENRNRNKNKQALIREDIWYMTGKIPPRRLDQQSYLTDDGPKYNAWGTCSTSDGGGNSCTYVPLSQRIPGYSKYAYNIALGAKDFQQLGRTLDEILGSSPSDDQVWEKAEVYLKPYPESNLPPPSKDALLKMALMGTAMLTTPNYSGPPRELLVSRYYINEVNFALFEISSALAVRDAVRAKKAWDFGKDSWNSYFVLVNRAIVPKVGDQFEMIV